MPYKRRGHNFRSFSRSPSVSLSISPPPPLSLSISISFSLSLSLYCSAHFPLQCSSVRQADWSKIFWKYSWQIHLFRQLMKMENLALTYIQSKIIYFLEKLKEESEFLDSTILAAYKTNSFPFTKIERSKTNRHWEASRRSEPKTLHQSNHTHSNLNTRISTFIKTVMLFPLLRLKFTSTFFCNKHWHSCTLQA